MASAQMTTWEELKAKIEALPKRDQIMLALFWAEELTVHEVGVAMKEQVAVVVARLDKLNEELLSVILANSLFLILMMKFSNI